MVYRHGSDFEVQSLLLPGIQKSFLDHSILVDRVRYPLEGRWKGVGFQGSGKDWGRSGSSPSSRESLFGTDSRLRWTSACLLRLATASLGGPRLPALDESSSLGARGWACPANMGASWALCLTTKFQTWLETRSGLQGIQITFQSLPGELRLNPCLFHSKAHSEQRGLRETLPPRALPSTLSAPTPGVHVPQPPLQQLPPE